MRLYLLGFYFFSPSISIQFKACLFFTVEEIELLLLSFLKPFFWEKLLEGGVCFSFFVKIPMRSFIYLGGKLDDIFFFIYTLYNPLPKLLIFEFSPILSSASSPNSAARSKIFYMSYSFKPALNF